jgi:TRAP-type C4-dicarboxylate transport system substrate-binding protein
VPRGAYAARAIGVHRWNRLSADERAILAESVAVWEGALERELRQANIAGEKAGHEQGMTFTAPSPDDAQRFLAKYNEVAEQNARLAVRYDLDGLRLFEYARAVVARTGADGKLVCDGEQK